MKITVDGLNRATLNRQLLLSRHPVAATEAVARVAGLQAQEPASPYLALWNRVAGFDPAELDAAFADRSVVKATLFRATLHAVPATDYPDFRTAMVPILRGMGLNDRRYTSTGLTSDDADALVPDLVAFGAEPRTGPEYGAWLEERTGVPTVPAPGLFRAFRLVVPFVHAPTGGPWSFGTRPAFVATPVPESSDDPAECLARLAARYLAAFGPASVNDFARFAMQYRPPARAAIRSVPDVVELAGPDGTVLYDVPDGPLPDPDVPAPPRLLGMWDNLLLAHADRTRIMTDEHRKLVIRANGDTLPTLLVDGRVAGVWRPVDAAIEATAFCPLSADAWAGLDAEAADLLALLADRDPAVYSRYRRWWQDLPADRVRLLGT